MNSWLRLTVGTIGCLSIGCVSSAPPTKHAPASDERVSTTTPVTTNTCTELALAGAASAREVRIETLVSGLSGTTIQYHTLRRNDIGFVGVELLSDIPHNQPPARTSARRLKFDRNEVEGLLEALRKLALDDTSAPMDRRIGLGTDHFPSARIVVKGPEFTMEFSSDMAQWQLDGSCQRKFSSSASARAEQTFGAFMKSIP